MINFFRLLLVNILFSTGAIKSAMTIPLYVFGYRCTHFYWIYTLKCSTFLDDTNRFQGCTNKHNHSSEWEFFLFHISMVLHCGFNFYLIEN